MEKLGSFERVRAVSVQLLASCIGLVSFFDSAKFAVKLSKEAQTKHEELLTLAAAPNFSQYENVPKPLPEISTYSSVTQIQTQNFFFLLITKTTIIILTIIASTTFE